MCDVCVVRTFLKLQTGAQGHFDNKRNLAYILQQGHFMDISGIFCLIPDTKDCLQGQGEPKASLLTLLYPLSSLPRYRTLWKAGTPFRRTLSFLSKNQEG